MTELERAEISARIKQARLEAGLTQEELADLLHVRQRTIANYESGRVPWRLISLIAEVTGKQQEWILHGDGNSSGAAHELAERLDSIEQTLAQILARLSG